MARASRTKALEAAAANSKIAGKKRARDTTDGAKPIVKRTRHQVHTFRFLDLPGELRNRIYQYAFEISYQTFPASSFRSPPSPSRNKPKRGKARPQTGDTPIAPIPYLGLTQSCTQIRNEFRQWWMGSHKLPLCALDSYFSTFFPTRSQAIQGRSDASTDTASKLRLFLRRADMRGRDLLRLFKHRGAFPDHEIHLEHLTEVGEAETRGLQELVNNQHPTWQSWIRRNDIISQIRIGNSRLAFSTDEDVITIVVKEMHSKAWMKPSLGRSVPEDFASSLGLNSVSHWRIDFSVDYS